LADPVSTVSIDPVALEQLPIQFGDWTGQDVPIDEAIASATDTDALINRRYSHGKASENVGLYIAYGTRARELMPHRPEVCYPCAGWTRIGRRSMELPLGNGTQLPCRILEFSRGTLNVEKVIILNYYIVDGQYCRDVSLLRLKAWRGSDAVGYSAQVQIVASIIDNITADLAEKLVCEFAVESASSIYKLFVTTKEARQPDDSRVDANHVVRGTGSG
jgi:EpsI family protein